MTSPQTLHLTEVLNAVSDGIADRLETLQAVTDDSAKVMRTLLEFACKSQNIGSLTATREFILRVPSSVRSDLIQAAASSSVNLDDEWEFRRFIELLRIAQPELVSHYLERGTKSIDDGVRQAAEDFKAK